MKTPASGPVPAFLPSGMDASRLDRLKARRAVWLEVHLWLGLVAGTVLVLAGLTGSVLVFWQEIDALLNPALHQVQPPPQGRAAYAPLAELLKAAQAAVPAEAKPATIYYPRHENLAFWFFYEAPAKEGQADTLNVFVNPYTGSVTGTRVWLAAGRLLDLPLISFLFELHYDLLLGWERGSWIVGVVGILAFLSVFTGLILWWPLTGRWRQAFTLKPRASAERLNYDLHKLFGVYSALVLLAVLISGVYFNFGDPFRALVGCFSTVTTPKQFKSTPLPDAKPITLDQAVAIANRSHPEGEVHWLTVPTEAEGVYVVTQHCDLGGIFRGRRQVVVDQYSSAILHVADPLAGSAGNVFLQWQWPLHSGQALRLPGRILVLVTGLACALLYVTGLVRWLQKRRARQRLVAGGGSKHGQR